MLDTVVLTLDCRQFDILKPDRFSPSAEGLLSRPYYRLGSRGNFTCVQNPTKADLQGDRIEREIVSRHAAIGIKAERYPLSGGSRFRGSGHDVDIYVFGEDEGPLVAEVKSRRCGAGFITLEKWLDEYDCLFLRLDSTEPMLLLPWRVWVALLARVRR